MLEQQRADAATCAVRIDEEGTDLRRLGLGSRVEESRPARAIAAEQRRAKAPAAAADHLPVFLDHEISLVGQQLGVDPEGAAQRAFNLRGPVVLRAQTTRGTRDQCLERGHVGERGRA